MINDPLRASVLAVKLIPNVDAEMAENSIFQMDIEVLELLLLTVMMLLTQH